MLITSLKSQSGRTVGSLFVLLTACFVYVYSLSLCAWTYELPVGEGLAGAPGRDAVVLVLQVEGKEVPVLLEAPHQHVPALQHARHGELVVVPGMQ